jgi:2-polyprenylphenol hydroxylase and related flavodoxin oxidoreductases
LEEQRDNNHPHICVIEKIVDETPTVRTLYFKDSILANVSPGQFAMIWIPGVNELPMSVMVSETSGLAALTVRKRGESSTALYNLSEGQQIGVRGPYGNSFDIKDGKILLIGGGTGLVPLMRLIKFSNSTNHITILMGSQTKNEVFFEETAKKLLEKNDHKIITVTEDGSYGEKG